MNGLTIELPRSLRAAVAGEASKRGVSEADWLAEAAREKLAAEAGLALMAERAARGDRAAYDAVLARTPAAPPEVGDER